jgi:4-hydroxy-2-oxovalerate aldolase
VGKKIKIFDLTLRDGSHAKSHQYTPEQMATLAGQIDKIGVEAIEFGHGNGLGGSSLQYGFAAASDRDYIEAVSPVIKNSNMSIIILPGVGTRHELNLAKEFGAKYARICTQISEVDIGEQHIKMAKKLGLIPISVLPCASVIPVEETVRYAQMAESYGAEVVYLLDGGGYQLPEQTFERISAMKKAIDVPVGFHGHNNLQLAVANSKAAVEAGAEYIDCCLKGFGAGAGNCPTEIFVAVLGRMGIESGVNLYQTMDIGDQYLRPLMPRAMEIDSDRIMLGYAGCYSSFLLFAQRAGEKYQVDPRDIIKEIGKRECTEGQENICIEVAYDLAKEKLAKQTSI